ncbi:hypothetical protein DFP72DRAFT_1174969 [Ephemerocybe angulata]|uniref:Uncharacterized protein n=1 Tax=Ephemerocybe angulata TaxID=980116 RepID=A0A8H6HJI1_9AGAR|nr:hypothetical protein DFP72DRAFT_1174969 [Tulosesus angulatus]
MLKSSLSSSQTGLKILYTASRQTPGAQKLTRSARSAPYSTFPKSDGDPSPPDVTVRPQGHGSLTFPLPPLPDSKPRPSAPSSPFSNKFLVAGRLNAVTAPPKTFSPSAPPIPPPDVTPIDRKALSELLTLLENSNSKDICNSDILHAIDTTPSLKSLFAPTQRFLDIALDLALSHSQDPTTNPARHLPALIQLAHQLQVPLTDRDFRLLIHPLLDADADLVTNLIQTAITTYGPNATLLHYKARSAILQGDFTWLPTFLPTFKALNLWPTRVTFHIALKAALIMQRLEQQQQRRDDPATAASECVQDILTIMQEHGYAPDGSTDALVLRHTHRLSWEGLRDLDKGALAAIAEQPLDNRKLNILNNLLWARLGETPPRDVGDLLDMLGGTEEGRRLAEIVRGSTVGLAASHSGSPSADEEQPRPESQSHESQLIQIPPNFSTYKTLISGIALKHKDLDTGALLLHELLSRGITVPDTLLQRLVRASLLRAGAKDTNEGQDQGNVTNYDDNGVALAIRFLASTCDARKTPVEDFMSICPFDFRMHGWPARMEGGVETFVLGPREFDSASDSREGGLGQQCQKPPSAEVFKEFMRGVLRLPGRIWDESGKAILRIMEQNGVEVDEEARELASELEMSEEVRNWWRERKMLAMNRRILSELEESNKV